MSLETLRVRLDHVRSLGGDLTKVKASPHLQELLASVGHDPVDQLAVAQRVEAGPVHHGG